MLRFAHTSDFHLGDSILVDDYRSAPDWLRYLLHHARTMAFERLVENCLESKLDFVLFAGDSHEGDSAQKESWALLANGFRRLLSAGVIPIVVQGNHDPLGKHTQSYPEGVVKFGRVPSTFKFTSASGVRVYIQGASYQHSQEDKDMLLDFGSPAPESDYRIGLLHCDSTETDAVVPCPPDMLRQFHFDYWALGHLHQTNIIHTPEQVIAYPGTPQGRSYDEPGPHGCLLVDVHRLGQTEVRKLALDFVRFEQVSIDVSGRETARAISAAIVEEVKRNAVVNEDYSVVRVLTVRLNRTPTLGNLESAELLSMARNQLASQRCIWVDRITC